MKMRLAPALLGLAISLALPIFAQQKEAILTEQDSQQLGALGKKWVDAMNNNDAAALAALLAQDAVFVTNTGMVYGREAIVKWYADDFQEWHHSNHVSKGDPNSVRIIGMADNVALASSGQWSETVQGKAGDPIHLEGYWSSICAREGNDWKIRMLTWNKIPASDAPETGRTQRINKEIAKPSH